MNKIATFFRESRTARFFIPAGMILIVFGVFMFIINTKNSDYIKTESVVSKVELAQEAYVDADGNHVEATYDISVKYTVDGKEYEAELNGLSERKTGDRITIYYNPSDPSQITQTKSLLLPIAIILGGIVAFVSGIISGIKSIKRYKKMKEQEKGWANE